MTTLSQRPLMYRGISLFVAIIFTVTTLMGSLPQAFASSEMLNFEGEVQESNGLRKDLYALPAELGSLVSSWEPPVGTASQEFIVHIQDAHANPEAQKNISGILKFLAQKYPNLAIGVEGVAGPLHPEYLQFFREFPEVNQAVVDDLLQKGELGGAELYLLQEAKTSSVRSTEYGERLKNAERKIANVERRTQNAVRVSGIEDIDLYRENLKTYRELLFKRDEMQTRLTPLRAKLDAEASRSLNADLLNFLKERKRRKEGRYYPDRMGTDPDLQAYIGYLNKQASKILRIDLKNPLEQLRFPNLMRIILVAGAQKGFDAAKAQEDWASVLVSMKKAAQEASGQDFVRTLESWGHEKGLFSGSKAGGVVRPVTDAALYPRKLLEQLFLFSKKHSFSFEGHGSFLQSFELLVLQAEVEASGLLEEMNALEGMLVEKLVKTDAEKERVSRLNAFDLLEKLLSLELTREEYSRIAHENEAMTAVVKDSAELKGALSRAYYFYDTTLLRDRILVENALALGKGHGGKETKVTVLITGGFHTDGIDAILREQQIGYVTLVPHISRTDRGELYQKVMAEDHADLSAYFKVKNPFATKQEALLFREMIEVATPVLSEKYQMKSVSVTAAVAQAVQAHPVLSSSVVMQPSGNDGKALRFVPRTLTPKNTAIAAPAITAEISFQQALTQDGSRVGGTSSNVTFGQQPIPAGAEARSETRENRQPLAKPIKKILVVDDEPVMRNLANIALGREGFEIVTADSGAEALEKLKTFTPDAVLTDIQMPGMTGPEWARQMSEMPGLGEIPIVFISGGLEDVEAFERIMEAFAARHPVHFLDKPFSLASLKLLFLEPEKNFKYWPEARSETRETHGQLLVKPIKRILLVDDEESITMSTEWMLGRAGFEVESASSGAEALEKLETFTPDAILTDVLMPGMTGPEWVMKAAKMPGLESIPVVFMSGFVGDQGVFDQAVEKLALRYPVHFVGKPFDINHLIAVFKAPDEHFRVGRSRSEIREGRKPLARPIEKILVVDDEPSVMMMTSIALTRKGFEVVTANSGAQALEKLKIFTPDAILTDVLMPGMTGPEWVLQMPQTPGLGEIPIVFMSGFTGGTQPELDRVVETLSQQRPVHFLDKPFSVDFLKTLFTEPEANFKFWPARSEIREEAEQSRALDALRARLVKQDAKFLGEIGRMNLSAIRTKMSGIWKPKAIYRDLMDLFSQWEKIRAAVLRDGSVNPKRIQGLKTAVDEILSNFNKQRYRGSRTDEKNLTPLRNSLEKWAMGYYKPTAFHEEGGVSNDALRKYIRKEADGWLVGMMRFIEMAPQYQTGFLDLVKAFPGTVLEWSLEPWQTSIDKAKSPEYVLSIMNRWHKFERLSAGELVDRYPPAKISEDRIGAVRRRQIFLFAEGLSFMTQAAKGLRPYQGTLPFKGSIGSPQRSELRGSTAEIPKSLMQDLDRGVFDQVKTLVPEADIPSIEFAADAVGGLYSERSIALLTQDAGKARLWIAMKLIEAMSASETEGQITSARLSQFLENFMASISRDMRTLAFRDAATGPQLHVNLAGLEERSWTELVRNFPVVLGLLVTLHASLSINVEAEGDALRSIQKQFEDLMSQEGTVLAPGQLRIVSAMGNDRFKSFEGKKEADAFMARDEKLLTRRKNVKSYWVTEDGNHMDVLTAGIATALLEVASDARLNAANTYKPSQYATLLAVVMNAIQGYLRIQTAA